MYIAPRITADPGKLGGKPCIRDLRFAVRDLLELLANGVPAAEILSDYPYLEAEDIPAALAYAASQVGHAAAMTPSAHDHVVRRTLAEQYQEARRDEEAEREAMEWVDADLGDTRPGEDWSGLRDAAGRDLVGETRPGGRGRDQEDPPGRDRLE